jgi:hypothetical protein
MVGMGLATAIRCMVGNALAWELLLAGSMPIGVSTEIWLLNSSKNFDGGRVQKNIFQKFS